MSRGIGGCVCATWAPGFVGVHGLPPGFVGVHGLPELPRATFVGVHGVPRGVTSYADALWLFLSRLGVQQLARGSMSQGQIPPTTGTATSN
jgi:hypothetical protein